MTDRHLLAACGLYCGACYHYRASLPDGGRLLAETARRGRPAAGYTCNGCRSDVRYVHAGCADCAIRACADARGVAHCGACPDRPCEQLAAFQGDGRVHHLEVFDNLAALHRLGPDQWLAGQAARWTCGCGARFSWYEMVCQQCGAALPSYGPDPTLRPKAILFDLDGTLIDFIGDPRRAWLEACQALAADMPGIDPAALQSEIEAARTWYWSDPDRHRRGRLNMERARTEIAALGLRHFGLEDQALAGNIAQAFGARRDTAIELLPGATETLGRLRELGMRLGLVTNGTSAVQRDKIERFGLARFFDCILIEGEIGAGKPEERVYLRALDELGVTAAETWMVGDHLEWEVAAPQRLGILGIWIDTAGAGLPSDKAVRPDRIVHSLSELVDERWELPKP